MKFFILMVCFTFIVKSLKWFTEVKGLAVIQVPRAVGIADGLPPPWVSVGGTGRRAGLHREKVPFLSVLCASFVCWGTLLRGRR